MQLIEPGKTLSSLSDFILSETDQLEGESTRRLRVIAQCVSGIGAYVDACELVYPNQRDRWQNLVQSLQSLDTEPGPKEPERIVLQEIVEAGVLPDYVDSDSDEILNTILSNLTGYSPERTEIVRNIIYDYYEDQLRTLQSDVLEDGERVYPSLHSVCCRQVDSEASHQSMDNSPREAISHTNPKHDSVVGDILEREIGSLRQYELIPFADGGSRQTFGVVYQEDDGATERCVIRIEGEGSYWPVNRSVRDEYEVLSSIGKSAVTVPESLWYGRGLESTDREYFASEWIEGKSMSISGQETGSSDLSNATKMRFLDEFISNLASLHEIPLNNLPLDRPDLQEVVKKEIATWERFYQEVRYSPDPILEEGFRWLRENPPSSKSVALIHGDYSPRNVLWNGTEITGILDWETVRISDPMFDLGYVTSPIFSDNSYEIDSLSAPVYGIYDEETVFDRYETFSGRAVSENRVEYWQLFTFVAMICVAMANTRLVLEQHSDPGRLLPQFDLIPERRLLLQFLRE